jgi:hypothetical protein
MTSTTESNVDSYPHPSFPSPNIPSVKEVKLAKDSLIEIICRSRTYLDAIRRIQMNMPASAKYTLLQVDKMEPVICSVSAATAKPLPLMLTKNISTYSLVSHETAWPELLDRVRQSLAESEKYSGNIIIQRLQDLVIIELVWN